MEFSDLTTLLTPKIDGGGNLNTLDISILVGVLIGTMIVGMIATIHAGESHLVSFLPCINKPSVATDGVDELGAATIPSTKNNLPTMNPRESNVSASRASSKLLLLQEDRVTRHGDDYVSNFFLADRGMKWYLVGGALFASNIGAEHFVGMAGDGAKRGLAVALYEWYAAINILMLGWLFSPIYRRLNLVTTPEFLERRFSAGCRHYLSIITCVMYVLTKMSASIYGGAVILQSTLGWNLYVSAGACILLATMYTVAGGLRAVMYTDLFQMCVFVTGGIVVGIYSLYQIGGFAGIHERLEAQGKVDHWQLFKPVWDEDYPWTGMLIGQPIGSVWYWCMDQDLVQRVLSAKDTCHAKAGCSFASLLKTLPPFMIVIPGIIASILYNMDVPQNKTDAAYPVLLSNLMPHGVIGLMIASIITAMMSSLASVFSAGSSVVANDIYLRLINPNASHDQLVRVGRMATLAFAILSFCWIPVLNSGEGLYKTCVEIQAYLAPPIGIVLILGVTWSRANYQGALAALLFGGSLGLIRLIFKVIYKDLYKNQMTWILNAFFYMNFQHFAIFLWVIAMITCVIVSLRTPRPPEEMNVYQYMIHWNEIFKLDESEKAKPIYVNYLVSGSAITAMVVTLSIWVYFIL
jgi:SSS family solute:Na+ symporter